MAYEPFLRSISLRRERVVDGGAYPFHIPAVKNLQSLRFPQPVTFFAGENGTGKSTLLEAIAVACGFNAEGGGRNFCFETCATHSQLAGCLRLVRGMRAQKDGYFLRAESYYNVASEIERLDSIPAASPAISEAYGGSPHRRSHGESFLMLLFHRLGANGLYLFDEPEAAVSPARQLSMLTRLHDLAAQGSQFIIATHSPILLAYPDSVIYTFSETGISATPYEETESYRLTKQFVNHYPAMLRELFS